MLKLRTPHERGSRARRGGRSIRSVAALVATSLIAPAAIATVATTLAASPASAAAPRVFVVAGDGTGKDDTTGVADSNPRTGNNSGAWGFHGADYAQLRSIITNTADFSVGGTVNAQFRVGAPIDYPITAEKLAGVDVFFSGAVPGSDGSVDSYTTAEIAAIRAWVQAGGILIVNMNSPGFNTGQLVADGGGVAEQSPEARFEPGPAPGIGPDEYRAPGTLTNVGASPLITGPFGTVDQFAMWHTVAGFTTLPGDAVVASRLTTPTCSVASLSCNYPTTPAQNPLPNPEPGPYRNQITNLPVLATFPKGSATSGNGAIVLTSDVDLFANHDEYNGGVMTAENVKLAKNTFAWIGGVLNSNNPVDGYTKVTPSRIYDSRTAGTKLGADGTLNVTVRGITTPAGDAIPADASGVVLNITADQPTVTGSYLTVYPKGEPTQTSNLNLTAGVAVPNSVIVKVGADGQVSIFNKFGTVNILVDIVGYFRPGSGDRLNSTSPARFLDTRAGTGSTATPIGAKESRKVQISGVTIGSVTVPTGSSAVVLNLTATRGTAGGYLTAYPGDLASVPTTSNLNFVANQSIANLAVVPLGADGSIRVYNDAGTTDVIADVLGYFGPNGGTFAPIAPARLLDTRNAVGVTTTTPLGAGATVEFTVLGRGNVPATGVRTVVLNVTATDASEGGYLTVFPTSKPDASNLNFVAGQTVPNLVVAQVNAEGKVKVYNNSGTTHVVADVVAWLS